MRPPRFAGHAGFTLVELLLAVTLMGILLGLAYGGLRAATRATENGQQILEHTGSIRATHPFLRRQFNQMQPLPFEMRDETEAGRVVFLGDRDYVQFVGPMPGYLGSGGPQVQVLQLVPGEQGDQLLFSHALLQGFTPERLGDREPIVLLAGIQSGGFEFLGRDEEGELTAWAQRWERPDQLPVAVMLDIEFADESPAIWPLLTTGVRIDASAAALGGGERNFQNVISEMIQNPTGDER